MVRVRGYTYQELKKIKEQTYANGFNSNSNLHYMDVHEIELNKKKLKRSFAVLT